MTTKERRQRQAIRVLRLDVLNTIDRLDAERCDDCRGYQGANAPVSKMRCGCAASVKIRELANLL